MLNVAQITVPWLELRSLINNYDELCFEKEWDLTQFDYPCQNV